MGKFKLIDSLEPAGDFKIAQSKDIAYNGVSVEKALNDQVSTAEQVETNTAAIAQNTADINTQSGKIEILTGKVTAAETAIAGKANQSEVDSIKTDVAGKASQAEVETIKTDVAGKASAETVTQLQTDMSVQTARMDQLVGTVPEGSADEIADARVTADGKTEENLGNAIRSQVSSLKETIANLNSDIIGVGKFLAYNGNVSVKILGNFARGGLDEQGNINAQKFRVSNSAPIYTREAINVEVEQGFRFGWLVTDSTGTASGTTWSGWYTSAATIPKGIYVKLQIARVTEVYEEKASVQEFTDAIRFSTIVDNIINDVKKDKKTIQDYTNSQTVEFSPEDFVYGYYNGDTDQFVSSIFRICSKDLMYTEFPKLIKCDDEHLFSIIRYTAEGEIISNSSIGWVNEITVDKNSYFKINIRLREEDYKKVDLEKTLKSTYCENPFVLLLNDSEDYKPKMVQGTWSNHIAQQSELRCRTPIFYLPYGGHFTFKGNGDYCFLSKSDTSNVPDNTWSDIRSWSPSIDIDLPKGYYFFQIANGPTYNTSTVITPEDIRADFSVIKFSVSDTNASSSENKEYKFVVGTEVKGFNAKNVLTYRYSGADKTRNGIAVYNNYLFSCMNPNELLIHDLSNGNLIADFTNVADIQHGDCCEFSSEFYQEGDEFPLLYVNTDNYIVSVLRVTRANVTTIRKYKFEQEVVGFYAGSATDFKSNTMYMRGYSRNAHRESYNNPMINTVWDLNSAYENEDGTYTPVLIKTFKSPYLGTEQDIAFYNGKLFVAISNFNHHGNEFIAIIDSESGSIYSYLEEIPSGLKNSELEGIDVAIENNKFVLYVSEYYDVYRFEF